MKKDLHKLFDEVYVVKNLPMAYFKEIDALVIADLHLGYEGIAAEQGVMIPKTQFEEEAEMLNEALSVINASTIIIDGDVKHEFSETSYHEFKEVSEMLKFLKENFERVIVVKGNHDNYIYYVTSRVGVELHDEIKIDGYYFTHGHKEFSLRAIDAKVITVAHEHPVVAMFDEVGGKEAVKCFLFGKVSKDCYLLLLPAFSTLSYGTEMNLVTEEELLSPVLKKVSLENFEVVGVDRDVGILEFGRLGRLRMVCRQ